MLKPFRRMACQYPLFKLADSSNLYFSYVCAKAKDKHVSRFTAVSFEIEKGDGKKALGDNQIVHCILKL